VDGAAKWAFSALSAAVLVAVVACSNEDDILPLEVTPVIACSEAAAHSDVVGDSSAELVRVERTSGSGLETWLATRHGPDGPSQSAAPTIAPRDVIVVCVFRGAPRQISMPQGANVDTTGVRVFVRFGGVTLDAVGAPDQLAMELDNLE
jgi:hypothetical protein